MAYSQDLLTELNVPEDAFAAMVDRDRDLNQLYKEYRAKEREVSAAESNGAADGEVARLRRERLLIKTKIEEMVRPSLPEGA
ncbi:DUF465 domain-containing protein [Streptomyces sp. NBC_00536]|uniref:DUF465 domain-containing protein n=1 Tax=Streptomyces sp. NBC_00536 TaxID=2975769 RepID=UPI002E8154F7|nr:DUF465 domain-containing protein [Streptomyces sp. NBC_00536]WUC83401.1 DUF465 domain-containing protein [Streptomyces sp. NBC_00536]